MKHFFFLVVLGIYISGFAQVGIGTITPQAQLDIKSSSVSSPANDDGILIPRVDEFPINNPLAAQDGILLFVTGIGTVEKGFYYWDNLLTQWIPLSKKRHYVGELFGGGIVYHVYDDGQHGLIASLDDLDGGVGVNWSNIRALIGASAQSVFNGASNTAAIIAQSGHVTSAASLCNNYSNGGYSDWYLPSIYELRIIENALLALNTVLLNDGDINSNPINFNNVFETVYWSSTESNTSFAWCCFFFVTDTTGGNKLGNMYKVRAVRSF